MAITKKAPRIHPFQRINAQNARRVMWIPQLEQTHPRARAKAAQQMVKQKPLEDRPARLASETARKKVAAGAGSVEYQSKKPKTVAPGSGSVEYEETL